jgi:hypothetical protein
MVKTQTTKGDRQFVNPEANTDRKKARAKYMSEYRRKLKKGECNAELRERFLERRRQEKKKWKKKKQCLRWLEREQYDERVKRVKAVLEQCV